MCLSQQADGAFEKEWYESVLPSASLILAEAAWRVCICNERGLAHTSSIFEGRREERRRHPHLCFSVEESHRSSWLAATLKNMSKDLFETTKPRKVTVTNRATPFPVPVIACAEAYNLLVEEGLRDPPWAGRCLVVREMFFARSPRRIGRVRCRRSFLPIRFDLGRSFRTALKIRNMQLVKHYRRMKALEEGAAESGELRVRRFVLKLFSECRGGRRSCRGHPEVASVVGVPFAEAGRFCDPVGGDAGLWACAHLPCTTGRLFLGQVINRFSCFLRLDAASPSWQTKSNSWRA